VDVLDPSLLFERYADDAIVHCRGEQEARSVLEAIRDRFAQLPRLSSVLRGHFPYYGVRSTRGRSTPSDDAWSGCGTGRCGAEATRRDLLGLGWYAWLGRSLNRESRTPIPTSDYALRP